MSIIKTLTGNYIDFANIDSSCVNIKDIAYALSYENRYCNQTLPVMNVAKHCIFVSHLLYETYSSNNKLALAGLFHDSSEGFMKDLPSGLKHMPGMECYREKENELLLKIFNIFNIDRSFVTCKELHKVDLFSRYFERIFLKGEVDSNFRPSKQEVLLFKDILKWSPQETEIEFISRYLILSNNL